MLHHRSSVCKLRSEGH